MVERGYCLVSQQIRERIRRGLIQTGVKNLKLCKEGFVDKGLEQRVQPSSFEPILSDEVFILDTEERGLLRPRPTETVYRTLLQLPKRRRQRVKIDGGFELKRGFSYLSPLVDRTIIRPNEFMLSSPKSSIGRLFLNARMIADYNPSINSVSPEYKTDTPLQLWLLLQPLAFNIIVRPGQPINQLRFFKGNDAQLTPEEVKRESNKNPLLYVIRNGKEVPLNPVITHSGMQIGLDTIGRETRGIFGLRARQNPFPVDLGEKEKYPAEDYFEPKKNDIQDKVIDIGEKCLFVSNGIIMIPVHLSAELRSSSDIGMAGQMHYAGFFDPGFNGFGVWEAMSHEASPMKLEDGMSLSTLDFFRTSETPDKIYGRGIGSNYQAQVGPRPSKHFRPFDWARAAKDYKKLDRIVLVQDAKLLSKGVNEITLLTPEKLREVKRLAKEGFFLSRYDCEDDELVLQMIPYVVLFGPNKTVFSFVRAENIKDYGDVRLFGKHSIAVGGHIATTDGLDYFANNINRGLASEVKIEGSHSRPRIVGKLMAYDRDVDRVHCGLVTVVHTSGKIETVDKGLHFGRMVKMNELMNDSMTEKRYETWSKMLIPWLPALYAMR